MKKHMVAVTITLIIGFAGWNLVNAESEHGSHGASSEQKAMDHSSMDKGSKGNTFTHEAVVDGIKAEFQVMSLADMKMKDPDGNTHHVMVKYFHEATKDQIKDVTGKIKVITPSGNEQVAKLKDYNGVFAANFTVKEKGKYGVICLFKTGGKKHLAKFWYHSS